MSEQADAKGFKFTKGKKPLIISVPHSGMHVPKVIADRFTDTASTLRDTDWWMDRVVAFAADMGCSVISAEYSRYVVDLNRPPDNASLYAGNTTGLVPDVDFDGCPIYKTGKEPGQQETAARIVQYWQPYHDKIKQQIAENIAEFGISMQLDAHSIRSQVPRLFDGTLPDLNIGSHDGQSASLELVQQVFRAATQDDSFTTVVDGRFKGGYITRHYGNPAKNIHAVQLEIAQKNYMEEFEPWTFQADKAETLQNKIKQMIDILLNFSKQNRTKNELCE